MAQRVLSTRPIDQTCLLTFEAGQQWPRTVDPPPFSMVLLMSVHLSQCGSAGGKRIHRLSRLIGKAVAAETERAAAAAADGEKLAPAAFLICPLDSFPWRKMGRREKARKTLHY